MEGFGEGSLEPYIDDQGFYPFQTLTLGFEPPQNVLPVFQLKSCRALIKLNYTPSVTLKHIHKTLKVSICFDRPNLKQSSNNSQ